MSEKLVVRKSHVYFALREDIAACKELIQLRRRDILNYTQTYHTLEDPTKRQTLIGQIPIPQTIEFRGFEAAMSILNTLDRLLKNVLYLDRYIQRAPSHEFYSTLGPIAEYIDTLQHALRDPKLDRYKYTEFHGHTKLKKPIVLHKSMLDKLKQLSGDVFQNIVSLRNTFMKRISQVPSQVQQQLQIHQRQPSKKRRRLL